MICSVSDCAVGRECDSRSVGSVGQTVTVGQWHFFLVGLNGCRSEIVGAQVTWLAVTRSSGDSGSGRSRIVSIHPVSEEM